MICHTYKCIFIHQRKCAGTSIIHAFDIPITLPVNQTSDLLLDRDLALRSPKNELLAILRGASKDYGRSGRVCEQCGDEKSFENQPPA